MKKRMCIYAVLIALALIVTACSATRTEKTPPFNHRFGYYSTDNVTTVIVDKQTGVCYLWVKVGYGAGLTVMVGPDGNPLIYEEEAQIP